MLEFDNKSAVSIFANPSEFKLILFRWEACDQIEPFMKFDGPYFEIGAVGSKNNHP